MARITLALRDPLRFGVNSVNPEDVPALLAGLPTARHFLANLPAHLQH